MPCSGGSSFAGGAIVAHGHTTVKVKVSLLLNRFIGYKMPKSCAVVHGARSYPGTVVVASRLSTLSELRELIVEKSYVHMLSLCPSPYRRISQAGESHMSEDERGVHDTLPKCGRVPDSLIINQERTEEDSVSFMTGASEKRAFPFSPEAKKNDLYQPRLAAYVSGARSKAPF